CFVPESILVLTSFNLSLNLVNHNSSLCVFLDYAGYIDHIVDDYESGLKNKYAELSKVKELALYKECYGDYKEVGKGFKKRVESMSLKIDKAIRNRLSAIIRMGDPNYNNNLIYGSAQNKKNSL